MSGRTTGSSAGLVGAVLIVVAAVFFGTLGPITRFADEAGVGSLAIVAWRAGIGASAMLLLLLVLRGAAGRRPLSIREVPARDRWFIGVASMANLALNLAMFIAFVRIEIGLALLVFYLYPAFVAVASVLWFGERLGAAIPTLCFITGIRLLGAPRAAILATLEPVVGVALAAW
ncbi:MAG: DMT family transporter, partial [Chloroflexota bacterium]|nr:DMT family transporter [Chloroflexota bacterium]